MSLLPAVFAGHGSPMNAIEDSEVRREWAALGARLPRPKAILCVSAHWETEGVAVAASEKPETIHDFRGFPRELHEMIYPATGSPALAKRVVELLGPEPVALDPERGLDHGAWSVLAAMYPDAGIPVAQLGLDMTRSGPEHFELAKRLSPLRDEGVLVLGSGNIVHNLSFYDPRRREPYEWAARFDAKVKALIKAGDFSTLAEHDALGPDAELAIPTPEHYLPLLYILALRRKGEKPSFFNERVENAMAMTSVLIG
ncbi:MAG: 4,5-DOPA dioxygenase extradiol [Elusimicrobia bacterium]|nr:4,5-DOPA dioxygenase extradiol [Elusimicrobiota bacterium]